MQSNKSILLLCHVLHPKPLLLLPHAIAWGIENEPVACKEYCKYMKANCHPNLTTSSCGFIIDQVKGWLGASPDAFVYDPSTTKLYGIAEFKCPYSKRSETIINSCQDKNFCCEDIDGHPQLKRQHTYHQVQLQLYVERDLYSWCDFCLYTPKDIIYPSEEWQEKHS